MTKKTPPRDGKLMDEINMVDVQSRTMMLDRIRQLHKIEGLSRRMCIAHLDRPNMKKAEIADAERVFKELCPLIGIEIREMPNERPAKIVDLQGNPLVS